MHSSGCKSYCGVREQYKGSTVHRCIYLTRVVRGKRSACFLFFFSLLLLLGSQLSGSEALLTGGGSGPPPVLSAARAPRSPRSPSNSPPFVHRVFCSSISAFLSFCCCYFAFIFVACCRFTILLRSGSDTQLVNERRHRLNEEVGRLQCVETAEQWPPLCELSLFFNSSFSLWFSTQCDY